MDEITSKRRIVETRMAFHASGKDLKRYLDSTEQGVSESREEISPEDSLKEWRRLAGFMNKLGTINK